MLMSIVVTTSHPGTAGTAAMSAISLVRCTLCVVPVLPYSSESSAISMPERPCISSLSLVWPTRPIERLAMLPYGLKRRMYRSNVSPVRLRLPLKYDSDFISCMSACERPERSLYALGRLEGSMLRGLSRCSRHCAAVLTGKYVASCSESDPMESRRRFALNFSAR